MVWREEETVERANLCERLARLAAFESIFEDPGFHFEMRVGAKPVPHQHIVVPAYVLSRAAEDFIAMLHEDAWIDPDVGERSLEASLSEARELVANPDAVARATPEQLTTLLTALVRQERTAEGALCDAFDSGLLLAIVRRAGALRQEMSSAGHFGCPS